MKKNKRYETKNVQWVVQALGLTCVHVACPIGMVLACAHARPAEQIGLAAACPNWPACSSS